MSENERKFRIALLHEIRIYRDKLPYHIREKLEKEKSAEQEREDCMVQLHEMDADLFQFEPFRRLCLRLELHSLADVLIFLEIMAP
jgi:hypothetical protein